MRFRTFYRNFGRPKIYFSIHSLLISHRKFLLKFVDRSSSEGCLIRNFQKQLLLRMMRMIIKMDLVYENITFSPIKTRARFLFSAKLFMSNEQDNTFSKSGNILL